MSERTEYWWIRYEAQVTPAEVGFVGGIPAKIRVIGTAGHIPATLIELIERLPAPPEPIFRPAVEAPAPVRRDRAGSYLWLFGILLLILVAQCSGPLFDALK